MKNEKNEKNFKIAPYQYNLTILYEQLKNKGETCSILIISH